MYNKINKIHMVGVGGIGMSGIAELLVRNGYHVTGSDLKMNDTLRTLEKLGARFFQGHHASNVEGAELVVYSSAIQSDNPEIIFAKERDIPVIARAEMLAELMRLKYGIAVAGAHGKTTTTSMISLVLMEGGLDPTIVVGGRMDNFGGNNARLGMGQFMVVEADESDGSFNQLSPSIAIVTNMDREHMDFYKTMPQVKKAFLSFLNKVPFYGLCVVCGDDPYLRMLLPKVSRRKKTYGFKPENFYQIQSYTIDSQGLLAKIRAGKEYLDLRLRVPGKHNLLNALAALSVGDELGIPRVKCLSAIASFQGVQRRFQKRGEINKVLFIDDYAHHPTEISSTLLAAKENYPKSKLRVVFQPHRYSRVEDLFDQFCNCFALADSVAITPIYAAGETARPGIDSENLSNAMGRFGHPKAFAVEKPIEGIEKHLAESAPGDIIFTFGAGDLPNVYRELFS